MGLSYRRQVPCSYGWAFSDSKSGGPSCPTSAPFHMETWSLPRGRIGTLTRRHPEDPAACDWRQMAQWPSVPSVVTLEVTSVELDWPSLECSVGWPQNYPRGHTSGISLWEQGRDASSPRAAPTPCTCCLSCWKNQRIRICSLLQPVSLRWRTLEKRISG